MVTVPDPHVDLVCTRVSGRSGPGPCWRGVPPSRLDPVVGCGGTLEEELVEDGVSVCIRCAGGPYDGCTGVLGARDVRVEGVCHRRQVWRIYDEVSDLERVVSSWPLVVTVPDPHVDLVCTRVSGRSGPGPCWRGVPPSRLDPVVGCGRTLEEELVEDGVSIGIRCAGGPYDGSAGILGARDVRVEGVCHRRLVRGRSRVHGEGRYLECVPAVRSGVVPVPDPDVHLVASGLGWCPVPGVGGRPVLDLLPRIACRWSLQVEPVDDRVTICIGCAGGPLYGGSNLLGASLVRSEISGGRRNVGHSRRSQKHSNDQQRQSQA